ncbi:MAG: M48 family metallopeptidase [Clostridia bacterium]|nr:M48 family metallopeptidase [Clostridia bacterium]
MEKFDYQIIRRKRKTIGIAVSKDGVKVSAPKGVSLQYIDEIIQRKASWISKKLFEISRIEKMPKLKDFTNGSLLPLWGISHTLKVFQSNTASYTPIFLQENSIVITLPSDLSEEERTNRIKLELWDFYKNQTAQYIKKNIEFFSRKLGVKPAKVLIKGQKKRWGSCSSKGNININWKIIMAPPHIIDYLLVHELAHLKEMNHSKSFWKLVESVLPDFKERSKWLKTHGAYLLSIEL